MLSAARMKAWERTRSSRGNTSIVYAPRPDQPAVLTTSSTTIIATNDGKPLISGQTR